MAFTIDVGRLRDRAANAARPASAASPASQANDAPPLGSDPYASLQGHYETLLACGLDTVKAFEVAEAVCLEHEECGDRRVCALECAHFRRGFCMNHRSAGVAAQLGELAFMSQRCQGFDPMQQPQISD